MREPAARANWQYWKPTALGSIDSTERWRMHAHILTRVYI